MQGHAVTCTGDKALLAQGGRGGRGNGAFKSALNSAPVIAEDGEKTEDEWLNLELKLIADVGVVGMPNAGAPAPPFSAPHLVACSVARLRLEPDWLSWQPCKPASVGGACECTCAVDVPVPVLRGNVRGPYPLPVPGFISSRTSGTEHESQAFGLPRPSCLC